MESTKFRISPTIIFLLIFSLSSSQCDEEKKNKISSRNIPHNVKHIDSGAGFVCNEQTQSTDSNDNIPEYNLRINKKTFKFKHLPLGLEGFKIGIIADMHIKFMKDSYLEKIIVEFEKQKPDVIFFLGDLVNYHIKEMDKAKAKILKRLVQHSKYGVYSILGNHDYGTFRFMSIKKAPKDYDKQMEECHKMLSWTLLKNTHVTLKHNNCPIKIVGIEQLSYCSTIKNRGDIDLALRTPMTECAYHDNTYKTTDSNKCFEILLAHDPDIWPYAYHNYKIPLTLSGHTHGSKKTGEFDTRNITHLIQLAAGSIKAPEINKECSLQDSKPGVCLHKYYGGTYIHDGCYLYVDQGCGFSGASLELNSKKNKNLERL